MASPPTSVPSHQSPLRTYPNPSFPHLHPCPNPTQPNRVLPTTASPRHNHSAPSPRPPRRPIHRSERINNFQSALDKQLEPKYFASLKIYTVDVESGELNHKKKAIRQRFELLIGTPGSVNVGRREERERRGRRERKRREEREKEKGEEKRERREERERKEGGERRERGRRENEEGRARMRREERERRQENEEGRKGKRKKE
ncbi:hypothetical protein Pmani_000128 [Petrolisthes manimaculis]|uniref:Uncharacterized protein n=1 Tax=Petrolisthes manimaculis TaxID=1843537 RepID=A0AAE1ULL1_9EUCA|nr:hypothetical protein Pmani_000128 [Petrolisthes manimaculis]